MPDSGRKEQPMPIDVHQVDIVIAAGTLFALKEELDRLRGQQKALQAENSRLCLENQQFRTAASKVPGPSHPRSDTRMEGTPR